MISRNNVGSTTVTFLLATLVFIIVRGLRVSNKLEHRWCFNPRLMHSRKRLGSLSTPADFDPTLCCSATTTTAGGCHPLRNFVGLARPWCIRITIRQQQHQTDSNSKLSAKQCGVTGSVSIPRIRPYCWTFPCY